MPAHRQIHVKNFINSTLNGKLDFNYSDHPGAHTEFVIAAARKRGLRIRKIGLGVYFYKGNSLVGGMRQMLSSLVTSIALSACANKRITKELLESSGVPVPNGQTFSRDQYAQAQSYFSTFAHAGVVKPADGSAGDGVTCGISSLEHFNDAWDEAATQTGSNGSLIVEEHVLGLDVRAFVVGSKLIAASTRLPAFVVGDGKSTIDTLVEAKAMIRKKNAYLRRMPIKIDLEWLKNSGHSMESVPENNEVVVLNSTVNLHQGGEHVDITDMLIPELKKIAIAAASAIPGLGVAGIDLLVKSPGTPEGAVVLEANTKANISVHHLPAYGKPVDVGAAIIDEMLRQHAIREAFAM